MSNLFLVGPMGAGKSTVGRMLAKELGLPFKDSDKEIERRSGADIPWIFDVEGEAGFREREAAVIAELAQLSGVVLATGGGAVLREENRQALKEGGLVIYLCATLQQQVERTSRDNNRPLLRAADPAAVLGELMRMREPLYRQLADIVVEANERPKVQVMREIIESVRKLEPHHTR